MFKFLLGLVLGAIFDDWVLAGLIWLLEYVRTLIAA